MHAISNATSYFGFDFCVGIVIKYLWRASSKGSRPEDIAKARWYLQWAEKKIDELWQRKHKGENISITSHSSVNRTRMIEKLREICTLAEADGYDARPRIRELTGL